MALEWCVAPEYLGAKYRMSASLVASPDTPADVTQLFLWRRGEEVAHEYANKQVTEIWNRLVNGAIRPVRYFDEHQRGIEYQPGEVSTSGEGRDWPTKYQLIPDTFFSQLTLEKTEGEGCNQEKHFELVNAQGQLKLVWLPEMRLVKYYEEKTGLRTIEWVLESVTAADDVDKAFEARASYQTTDYADIGDNESDPFLRKMINLGFVSHGASGFYNSDGQQLQGHQHPH